MTISYCQLVLFGYYSEGVPNKQWLRIFRGPGGGRGGHFARDVRTFEVFQVIAPIEFLRSPKSLFSAEMIDPLLISPGKRIRKLLRIYRF